MITAQLLAKIFPGTRKSLRDRFVEPMNRILPLYGINTKARGAAFLANGGVETDYLRTTTEYASGADYEWREDLGNTQEGDGKKFRGHGFFQTTGRFNHRQVTKATFQKLGIDFEKNPERLAELDIAVESACIFWRDNNTAKYADKGDFFAVSGIVNQHCKSDSVKNILAVVLTRIISLITGVWSFGLGGKIALVLICGGISVFSLYAFIYYRKRIFGWIKTIFDSLLNS